LIQYALSEPLKAEICGGIGIANIICPIFQKNGGFLSKAIGKALAVDDEPTDLEAIRQTLVKAGYEVATAGDANSAMEIFQSRGPFHLLVTDVAMSPTNGCDLAGDLVKLKPDLRVVFVSGYSGSQSFRYKGVPLGDVAFVPKPFDPEVLISKVQVKTEPCG
jgi:two-component system cell cycle sensor histidine kinase/response regulator CckA